MILPFCRTLPLQDFETYRDHRGFQVHTESVYPKGLEAARYIGCYLGHPPLATSHLIDDDGQRVMFWYQDTAK